MSENKNKKLAPENSSENLMGPVLAIFCLLLAIIFFLANFGQAGNFGQMVFNLLFKIFGWPTYFAFLGFLSLTYYLWQDSSEKYTLAHIKKSSYLIFIFLIFLMTALTFSISNSENYAGILGKNLSLFLTNGFGQILGGIISLFLTIICLIMLIGEKPKFKLKNLNIFANVFTPPLGAGGTRFLKIGGTLLQKIKEKISKMIRRSEPLLMGGADREASGVGLDKSQDSSSKTQVDAEDEELEINAGNRLHQEIFEELNLNEKKQNSDEDGLDLDELEKISLDKSKSKSESQRQESLKMESKPIVIKKFIAPNLALLSYDIGKSSAGDSKFKMNAIQKTLDQFGIPVEMGEVTVGPSVTQFTLKPAQGVNIKKILSLKDNLQMALSATNMHIQAPIPGRPFLGIEIPNEKKSILGLRSLLELEEFQSGPALSLAIGKNIIGQPIISDLGKMPHLLVAGATGTGKSVTLHNLIMSLLYKNSPYDLKLIILDPKRVEFTAYNSLPHLYTPIIKDAKSAIKSLNWAAQEMDRRYDVLGEYGVPNINDYNKKILFPAIEKAKRKVKDGESAEGLPPKMPFIVIVFDEFNDFMLTYPKEITPIITSLSQKARAAGIHLILATQRPDVKVITGTIKANIPSRIALKTTSSIDSRTILDQQGAEDLLGNGDMLYMNGSQIVRVQAPFISTEEIREIIKDIKHKYNDFIPEEIDISKIKVSNSPSSGYREMEDGENRNPSQEPTEDEDYLSAKDYVISTGKASTSALQTAFRWGYNKSARIINDLENYGIISPAINGRNREVIFGRENVTEENIPSNESTPTKPI